MVFVADDLAAWLIGLLADAGRKKLTLLVLGDEQERAMRSAATAAVRRTAEELRPGDDQQAAQLAMVISQVFSEPVPGAPLPGQATVLEALQIGIAGQLEVLDDASITETAQSSADVLGVTGAVVAEKLTGHLVREILVRGTRGGPLAPLADQLNHDVTHLQGQRLEGMVGKLAAELQQARVRLDTAPSVRAVPVALVELPLLVAGFTGRDDELAELAGFLDPAGTAGPVVVSAVAGLAGVGKTTLAVAAGHAARRRGWFAGGVLFVDLHGYDEAPVQPGQALDALLRALRVPAEQIPPGTDERARLYRSVLAQISDPVLVVVDNASSEAQVRPLLPGTDPHKVLVTSRHTLAGLGARLVDVMVLDDAASLALLEGALRVGRPGDNRISSNPEAAGRLTQACDGLPLALQIVAAVLKADPMLTVDELADELGVEHERLGRLRYDDGSDPSHLSVEAAFELSYRRLDETSARVFRLLPVNPGPAVSTVVVAVLASLPVGKVRGVMSGLARAHLAEAAPGAGGRWRMHNLVRLYAQRLSDGQADADGREHACDRLLDYYLRTTFAADQHVRALPGMAVPDDFTDRDAALEWLDGERASLVAAVSMAADTGRDQIALGLPSALVEYFRWRRQFDDLLATVTISLKAARRLGYRNAEGMTLNHLGLALTHLRRFDEAITACRAAVAILRETGDWHGEGMAQFNLGVALQDVRRFDEAIAAFVKDLEICSETGDLHGKAITLDRLGSVLREIRRFDEAITAHQQAVAIFRETGDRNGEGSALNNLGPALQKARRFDEAITACQQAVAILRETGDRYSLGTTLMNVGAILSDLRRFEEAITPLQEAAAIFREIEDLHAEAGALSNLGVALREVRRYEEAVTTCQDAATIFRETGDRHGKAAALNNLGIALRFVGRFEEAVTTCQDAAAIYRDTGDRNGEGMALGSLGRALAEVLRYDEAITAHQGAAAIFRKTGDRYAEAMALDNLGSALQEVQRYEEAITAHRDAAAIYRDTGDRHEAGALNNLGVALAKVRQYEEAITACQDAAANYGDTGDRNGEGMALGNLGSALREVQRYEEAITACQDAAALLRETGDRHAEGTALGNLGQALQEAGRVDEAITARQGAAAIFRETGDRHAEGAALNNLGLGLQEAGRVDEAITACQDAAAIFRETGDRHAEGTALGNLGQALQEAGRVDEAITACQDAAAIFRETGDRHAEGTALDSLGWTLLQVRKADEAIADEAITAYQGAAAIYQETGDRYNLGSTLIILGAALSVGRRYDEAITACQGAAALLRETGDRYAEGMALNNLGQALREAGRFDEAITACQDAAAIFRETGDQNNERIALRNLEAARDAQLA